MHDDDDGSDGDNGAGGDDGEAARGRLAWDGSMCVAVTSAYCVWPHPQRSNTHLALSSDKIYLDPSHPQYTTYPSRQSNTPDPSKTATPPTPAGSKTEILPQTLY